MQASGCSAQIAPAAGAPGATLEPYVETIPGTVVELEMIPVPAGRVEVEGPQGKREVAVGPLWMSKHEITWDAYDVYVYGLDKQGGAGAEAADAVSRPSKPYVLPGESFGHQGNPALAMTHEGAERFAEWLSAKTGKRYRLATEAEWEYVCRAGSATTPPLGEQAWHWDNASDRTHKVGSLAANPWGFHDLLGNVAEWVNGTDGVPVVKGGSFDSDAEDVHCGARRAQTPAWNATDPQLPKSRWWLPDAPFVGFRIVRQP